LAIAKDNISPDRVCQGIDGLRRLGRVRVRMHSNVAEVMTEA